MPIFLALPSSFSLVWRYRRGTILFPYTTLFRSAREHREVLRGDDVEPGAHAAGRARRRQEGPRFRGRSEEHTSELQSLRQLVCRLLLEKKKLKEKLRSSLTGSTLNFS